MSERVVTNVEGRPLARRGLNTRRRLLDAAEQVFLEHGYYDASIVKITALASGCVNAWALEFDNASHGTSIALRIARDLLRAEPELRNVLMVAASRESELIDFANETTRFAFNFGDGAVAALLAGEPERNEVLGAHTITDGAYSLHVEVPGGGSSDKTGYRLLDVSDGAAMKEGLDPESLPNFVRAVEGALERSGATLAGLSFLCPLHMKRSMFRSVPKALGIAEERAEYLDDAGHMSGVDPLLGLDRAARAGKLRDGDLVALLSAGTGYTWAASIVRWGPVA